MRHAQPTVDHDIDSEFELQTPPSFRQHVHIESPVSSAGRSYAEEINRVIWPVVSLVSTKYIVVDRYFHYPLHLLACQIATFLIFSALLDQARSPGISVRLPWLARLIRPRSEKEPSSIDDVIGSGLRVLALPFAAQAVLHFPNLPTLGLLVVFGYFWETLVYGINANDPLRRRWTNFIPAIIFLIATFLILYDEYRIEADGLLFCLPAWAFIGISQALLKGHGSPDKNPQPLPIIFSTPRRLAAVSLVVTVLYLSWKESIRIVVSNLRLIPLAVFFLNLGSTAITLNYFLSARDYDRDGHEASGLSSKDATRGIIWAASCAILSTFITRPTISTPTQVFGACAATLIFIVMENHPTVSTSPTQQGRGYSVLGLRSLTNHDSTMSRFLRATLRIMSGSNLLLLGALVMWNSFTLLFWLRTPDYSTIDAHSPSLDRAYQAMADFDIVVSAYQEPVSSIQQLVSRLHSLPIFDGKQTRLWIYTKDPDANLEDLAQRSGAHRVFKLLNIGREGETYLYHINQQWDNLAKHTLFVQAHIHNPWEFFGRIRQYYVEATGMLSLGFTGHICDCYNCQDRWGFHDDTGTILPDIWASTMGGTCRTPLLSYKGQFIASAKRIRGIDRAVYQKLHGLIKDPESDVHKPNYLKGRPDSLGAPFFGYTLERLWSMVLQCSEYRIAQLCPSVLSGRRSGGSPADCQCLDYDN